MSCDAMLTCACSRVFLIQSFDPYPSMLPLTTLFPPFCPLSTFNEASCLQNMNLMNASVVFSVPSSRSLHPLLFPPSPSPSSQELAQLVPPLSPSLRWHWRRTRVRGCCTPSSATPLSSGTRCCWSLRVGRARQRQACGPWRLVNGIPWKIQIASVKPLCCTPP